MQMIWVLETLGLLKWIHADSYIHFKFAIECAKDNKKQANAVLSKKNFLPNFISAYL